ncbi:peptidylprolyl isomerase [Mycobacterium sp. 1423905.2]|uniref:peptidylprolyl isomerase n=1 Tax=Mycobacterium sp. 1423905.2 TaxID=1856859 RepID=UPI0009F20B97|nr:peptidylprolyl isomerase [Mycobacterium sp. 1423905.2]
MAKDPQVRYQSVQELAEAARAALSNTVTSAPHAPIAPTQPQPETPAAPSHASNWSIWVGVAAAAVLILVAAVVFVYVRHDDKSSSPPTAPPPPTSNKVPDTSETVANGPNLPALPAFSPPANVGANCQYPSSTDPAAKSVKPPRTGTVPTNPAQVPVTMTTNQGAIGLNLANNKAPCTVNSFVSLAQQGFFDDTQCHRLTTAQSLSVLQCGDPKGDGTGGPGYEFANEYPTNQFPPRDRALNQPMVYPRGTIAMANAGVDTNGSQFFLVYDDSELPPQYTVFGTMDEAGTAVVEKIAKGGVVGGGDDGTPATTVTITSIRLD